MFGTTRSTITFGFCPASQRSSLLCSNGSGTIRVLNVSNFRDFEKLLGIATQSKRTGKPFVRQEEEFGVGVAQGAIGPRREVESAHDGDRQLLGRSIVPQLHL